MIILKMHPVKEYAYNHFVDICIKILAFFLGNNFQPFFFLSASIIFLRRLAAIFSSTSYGARDTISCNNTMHTYIPQVVLIFSF